MTKYAFESWPLNGESRDTQVFQTFMSSARAEGAEITESRRSDIIRLGGLELRVLPGKSNRRI